MGTRITKEAFVAGMEKAVKDRGEGFVYPAFHMSDMGSCLYVYNGEPDCLIANALVNAGVEVGELRPFEDESAEEVVPQFLSVYDSRLCEAATAAQSSQDNGHTWGEALTAFREKLAEKA